MTNKGWLIPQPIEGNDEICLTVTIPNNRRYIAAVVGAITETQNWYNWEKSGQPGDTRATETAQVMRRYIYNTLKLRTNACLQAFAPVRVEYELPRFLSGHSDCWTIETSKLDGQLNIIQRTEFAACGPGEFAPPESWNIPAGGNASDDMDAIDINLLQQQIDALQSELDTLQGDLSGAQSRIDDNELAAANALSAGQFAFSVADGVRNSLDDLRQDMIASVRWFPSNVDIPDGWVFISGQRIPRLPTNTGDSVVLYDRVLPAWRDGDDTLLPNSPAFVPAGFNSDGPAGGLGITGNFYGSSAGGGSFDERIPVIGGGWYIYIGDSAIS